MKQRSLLLVLVAVASAASTTGFTREAAAEEATRHTVKPNETCAAIAQHYYGDSRLVDVIHKANPDLASKPPPHNLKEGMILIIPPKPTTTVAPDAQLTAVRNRVELLTPESRQGKPNDPLFRGNRVSTQEASAADVTFRDETQVKLGERTLVVILGDARSAAAKAGEMQTTLVTGNLRAFMSGGAKKATGTAVATDSAGVRIINGEAKVSADAKKTTRVAVYQGNSTIAAQGKTQEVARNFGSKANAGQAPTPPRPLPAAPVWTAAPEPVLVALDGGEQSFVGEYAPAGAGPKVAEWRVQIARDDAFRDVVTDVEVPVTTARLEGKAPGPGRYFVRVSAIDDDHFEGPYGRTASILVVGAKKTALGGRRRVEIVPLDAFCVRVGNVQLARVQGPIEAPNAEPIRLRCAATEEEPTTLLSFD